MRIIVSQADKQNLPIRVTEFRADSYSADGDIVISLRTKYSKNERKYSVPPSCFRELIVDLKRLNAFAPPTEPDKLTEQAKPESLLPEISIISK